MKLLTFTLLSQFTVFNGALYAQELETCNVRTFAEVLMVVDKASDDKRDQAIVELKIARAKMAEGDDDACLIHLANASDMAAAK
jgi:hypothetical protein